MKKVCVVLYSGGCDSTLAAAVNADRYEKVRLITYNRLGFFKARENAMINLERLKQKFGPDKFCLEIIDVNNAFKRIQYDNYIYYIKKYGPICMSICGLCKLAMHWQTILYCMERSIADVCDGAVKEMSVFPAQNKDIALENTIKLYGDFNINYYNPVYEIGKDVERTLYDMQIIPSRKHKLTDADKQVVCSQQILFAKFVKYYLSEHSWDEYVSNLHDFYSEKINDIRNEISKTSHIDLKG